MRPAFGATPRQTSLSSRTRQAYLFGATPNSYSLLARQSHIRAKGQTRSLNNDKLALGFIEECDKGGSPWSTPWFFTGKKDGGLRPLQDYRVVNSWTIHDVYPIPQIEQILEELEGKVLFMALDIWWGYHNIWICEEDQWKAVLQFSPHVVPQCLCLSLRCVTCYLFKVPASVACDHEYRLHKMDCLFCCSGSLYLT